MILYGGIPAILYLNIWGGILGGKYILFFGDFSLLYLLFPGWGKIFVILII